MKHDLRLIRLSDDRPEDRSVELSSSCPVCGVSLLPKILYGTLVDYEEDENDIVFLLNFCNNCDECFISKHGYDIDDDGFYFQSSAPFSSVKEKFSDNIQSLSPEFVSIYNDALNAEHLGMHSICGMGYRKALEFLVKDYSIKKHPEDSSEIIKIALSQCIKKYIPDERLRSLATASTWLGNDETHYIKKHANYGLPELKTFIKAFITFIDAELAYDDALEFLSSK